MHTQQEILTRIEKRKPDDFFGFEVSEYIDFLDFEHARPFLVAGATAEVWAKQQKPNTREAVLAVMLEYMPFAWEKANNCRGISANRSIAHFVAWTWLAGDDEFSREVESTRHEFYGKPALIKICERYGWDWKQWDDGVRTNTG